MSTNRGASNNTHLFSHDSGGQKSNVWVLTWMVPSGDSEGESIPWCSPGFWWLLVIPDSSWLIDSRPWSQAPHLQMGRVERMSQNLLVLKFSGFHKGGLIDHHSTLWVHVLECGSEGRVGRTVWARFCVGAGTRHPGGQGMWVKLSRGRGETAQRP